MQAFIYAFQDNRHNNRYHNMNKLRMMICLLVVMLIIAVYYFGTFGIGYGLAIAFNKYDSLIKINKYLISIDDNCKYDNNVNITNNMTGIANVTASITIYSGCFFFGLLMEVVAVLALFSVMIIVIMPWIVTYKCYNYVRRIRSD